MISCYGNAHIIFTGKLLRCLMFKAPKQHHYKNLAIKIDIHGISHAATPWFISGSVPEKLYLIMMISLIYRSFLTVSSYSIKCFTVTIDIITHTGIGNGSCARDVFVCTAYIKRQSIWCPSALLPVSPKVPNKDFSTPLDGSVVP